MNATAKFWDGIAEKYARTPVRDMESYEHTLRRTASYLKSSDKVLELGCGTGTTALKLAPNVAEIVASDVSAGMLAVGARKAAEQSATNVSFVEAEAGNPPEGPFDAVLAFNLLHLVEDLDGTLAKVRNTLKPGGLFVSKTFCAPKNGSLRYRFMRMVVPVMQVFGKAPFVRFMSEAELDAAIKRAGFEFVERDSFPVKDARRFVVARRI
ncbi:class I SAM-dependent methyltransferase [Ruegeria sediminis]|uniref:Class I SAM-dependent methyltransferase n=1 Tax=Ruegeria sediminis TaxID=2583820 RepID=A0ABY2WU74_9RHOB|nr:class I SAM-dependent methyltransferase [Ruegeria sediminis]TMV03790.1 class I SAM-dependent methyltransferase [Ruegeria sediminis]